MFGLDPARFEREVRDEKLRAIARGTGLNLKMETFQPLVPASYPIDGFLLGHRIRVVGSSPRDADRFHINLRADNEIAFHFNPRFSQNCVVRNSFQDGKWNFGMEERVGGMPLERQKMFTIDLIEMGGFIRMVVNGKNFAQYVERMDSKKIKRIEIDGDIEVHSVQVYTL
ncbi:hypothetical protein PFISCL1PPCAC_10085 [Pristionchus fissidentatus]|uniref:Galectin n=1 Tax=Pristionchus fissidentatus TaxID=1538716 RepID=A0AAV5VKI9_9BILA|nr:hypothetical protein PFISCL1PPCAC_10085 [Pristionchus fissidentatus]